MVEDMRGLFVIVKGQYEKKCEPRFFNEVSQDYNYIGGYDPAREDTRDWYMLYDRETMKCHVCSADYNKVLRGVFKFITKYKNRTKFLRAVKNTDQTHSPIQDRLMAEVINTYGDFYEESIEAQEDKAYKVIKEDTPFARTKKRLGMKRKTTVEMVEVETPLVTTPSGKKKGLVLRKISK